MIARYLTSVTGGAAVTFGLLFLMQHLIATGERGVKPRDEGPRVKFADVRRDEPPRVIRELPKPPDEVAPPPAIDIPTDAPTGGGVPVLGPPPTPIPTGPLVQGGWQSGDLLPIVAVAPVYPARALTRNLEGYVVLEFTVTEIGTVRDAFVVTSTGSVFERPAIEAVYKFKYKPRVVDGTPVETPGIQRKFIFVLEN